MTAVLVLEDGTVFRGRRYGAAGLAVGELVFTTAMTGYQEVVTDPSYAGQLVTFTQPMIGNYGVEPDVSEAARPHARAVVVRAGRNSRPGGREGFSDWLARQGVVGIEGVDTRAITRRLRDGGAVRAGVASGDADVADVLARVRAAPAMAGLALAGSVSRQAAEELPALAPARARVAVLDYGVKASIVRLLREAGADVVVLPWDAAAGDVLAQEPDGVLLGNGPGDPAALDRPAAEVRALLEAAPLPVFGICLGHQLLARAAGLSTYKLRFGHRGANHPVLECESGRVLVTVQNHGFAVALPAGSDSAEPFDTAFGAARVTHLSLYDGTVEGLALLERPASSLQFHPEASPGPHDARPVLGAFVDAVAERRSAAVA